MIPANSTLLGLLGKLTLWKVTRFATDSEGLDKWEDDRFESTIEDGANLVSSLRANTKTHWLDNHLNHIQSHAILLDLDVPAYLVPSSRPGHTHLYIDVNVPEEAYFKLLDALADCGVIERGYASASKKKGGTFLRLPWIKKEGVPA